MVHPDGGETKESEVNLNNEYKEKGLLKTRKMNIIKDFINCMLRKH